MSATQSFLLAYACTGVTVISLVLLYLGSGFKTNDEGEKKPKSRAYEELSKHQFLFDNSTVGALLTKKYEDGEASYWVWAYKDGDFSTCVLAGNYQNYVMASEKYEDLINTRRPWEEKGE